MFTMITEVSGCTITLAISSCSWSRSSI
jgi:hypothetical protein